MDAEFRYTEARRERDVEMQLADRPRYYDPATRRWITDEPISFDAGDNVLVRYLNQTPPE